MINSIQVQAAINHKVNLTILLGDAVNQAASAAKKAQEDALRYSCDLADEEGLSPQRRAEYETELAQLWAKAEEKEAFARRVAEAAEVISSVPRFVWG